MKKLFIITCVLLLVLLGVSVSWANGEAGEDAESAKIDKLMKMIAKKASICPTTKMDKDCLTCHESPGFELKPIKEKDPADIYDPPYGVEWIIDKGEYTLYYKLTNIHDGQVFDFYQYASRHSADRVIIEIYSPGGGLMAAWRIVGLIKMYENRGIKTETRVHGYAASAGFVIFVSGSKGMRMISPQAELMWHELVTFKMYDVSGPSDKEDEAKVLRHLQDTSNSFLASVSKLTKKEWDALTRKKEFWTNGKQALEKYGLADGYL